MTEQERKIVIKRIEDDLADVELLKSKEKRKEELEQKPEVKEYLENLEQIKKLNDKLNVFNNEEDMIKYEFIWAFQSRIKGKDFSKCPHDIWLYTGSYNLIIDPRGEHNHYNLVFDETAKNFDYNEYCCLECGKTVQEKNWQEFEKNHLVLKNRDYRFGDEYSNKYFKLLYEKNSIEEAQKEIINSFYEKKAAIQILRLKKR